MPRIQFEKGQQKHFLECAKSLVGGEVDRLAVICGVHPRTLRDWLREKYRISHLALLLLENRLQISAPSAVIILPDYSHVSKAGKVGGIKRYQMYGNPATSTGRSKGGANSCRIQQKLHRNGIATGFVVRKTLALPRHSEELAEAIGIVLGDGSITKFQIHIALSALVDQEYSEFVVKLFEQLFGVEVVRQKIVKNTIRLTISSRQLVEWFVQMGLTVGDKIKQNMKIPDRILRNKNYLRACLRGLFDTDGCIYYHRHYVRGHEYNDVGWEFRSLSKNFLSTFNGYLLKNNYRAKLGAERVDLYRCADIQRYFEEVGSHNIKHHRRFVGYLGRCGRGAGAAELAALEMP